VAKLASVWWKTHWKHVSQPFLPPELRLRHFGPGMRRNQNFEIGFERESDLRLWALGL